MIFPKKAAVEFVEASRQRASEFSVGYRAMTLGSAAFERPVKGFSTRLEDSIVSPSNFGQMEDLRDIHNFIVVTE